MRSIDLDLSKHLLKALGLGRQAKNLVTNKELEKSLGRGKDKWEKEKYKGWDVMVVHIADEITKIYWVSTICLALW